MGAGNDGTLWGAWSNAFTVTAPIDTGPVETVSNLMVMHGEKSFAAASLFSYSDPVGSAATEILISGIPAAVAVTSYSTARRVGTNQKQHHHGGAAS